MRHAIGAACAVAALAAAGCGGGEQPVRTATSAAAAATAVPNPTPQPFAFTAGAREALATGAVGVVDLEHRAGVAPRRLVVNREQTLTGVRWSGWGDARATGRGRVETLVCEPTCATGRIGTTSAVIVLSAPRRCGAGRFYTRSTMTYEEEHSGRTRAPDTYLRTPPC
jgi:hypothetical protein